MSHHVFEMNFGDNIAIEANIADCDLGQNSNITIVTIDEMQIRQRKELQRLRDALIRFHLKGGFINKAEITFVP